MSADTLDIVVSLVSGLLGGVIVAVVNYLLSRKKREAEIRKLEAETSLLRSKNEVMLREVEGLSETVGHLAPGAESVLYDSSRSCSRYDFEDKEGRLWSSKEGKHVGPTGRGMLTLDESGTLNIQRTNTEGRFEVWLCRYEYKGEEKARIPKNESIAGARKLRVSCQAKTIDGEHTLHFVIKDPDTGVVPTSKMVSIAGIEWIDIDLVFLVSPSTAYVLRIDDRDVSHAPSSVQIRSLRLAERAS